MRTSILPLVLATACMSLLPTSKAEAQLPGLAALIPTPVAFQYTCPTQAGTLPKCTTTYNIPYNKLLVIQNVSGSATPINPNAAGNFATGQASLTIATQLSYENEPVVPNIVGPNYALANTAVWFFNTPVALYTDVLPVVSNNGGSVFLQGYVIDK